MKKKFKYTYKYKIHKLFSDVSKKCNWTRTLSLKS